MLHHHKVSCVCVRVCVGGCVCVCTCVCEFPARTLTEAMNCLPCDVQQCPRDWLSGAMTSASLPPSQQLPLFSSLPLSAFLSVSPLGFFLPLFKHPLVIVQSTAAVASSSIHGLNMEPQSPDGPHTKGRRDLKPEGFGSWACALFYYIPPSGNQGLLFSPPPISGSLEIEECKSAIMMEGEGLVYFYLISLCAYCLLVIAGGPACAGFKCHKLAGYFEWLDIPVTCISFFSIQTLWRS